MSAVLLLSEADQPVDLIDSWGRQWNHAGPGDRIRLDNEPYKITHTKNGDAIICEVCHRASFNQEDIANRWCGNCGRSYEGQRLRLIEEAFNHAG